MTQNSPEHSESQAPAPQPEASPPVSGGAGWAQPDPWPAQEPWLPPGGTQPHGDATPDPHGTAGGWQQPANPQTPSPHLFPSETGYPVAGSPQGAPAYGPPPSAPAYGPPPGAAAYGQAPGWGGAGAQRPWPGHVPQGPRPVAYPAPVRFEQVPGENFGLAILPAPRTLSGVAVGSLVTGIGSVLVSGAVWCFGTAGASGGWGGLVAGAFFVLSALLGVAGVVLGVVSLRQIRRGAGLGVTGRGYGISGVICGGVGLLSAAAGLAIAIALSNSS